MTTPEESLYYSMGDHRIEDRLYIRNRYAQIYDAIVMYLHGGIDIPLGEFLTKMGFDIDQYGDPLLSAYMEAIKNAMDLESRLKYTSETRQQKLLSIR